MPSLFRFGEFEADTQTAELRKNGDRIKLQEQPFQVLAALLNHPYEVVTREALQKRLWPDGTFVDFDRGLNKAVNRLREALGDDAEKPRFIETLPGRGYRFIAPADAVILDPAPDKPQTQKGIQRRALLAACGLVGIPVAFLGIRRMLSTPEPRIESIAVLPLENLSGDPSQEYFADGMTDELIGAIAQISSLRVISRTSVMRFKKIEKRKPLPEIARELGADAIVEGTVSYSGNQVRISAQLIRASDDRHLWAGSYQRDVANVLAMQGEVARVIVGQIKSKLAPREPAAPPHVVSSKAYETYLQGNYFLHQGIRGIAKSVELFQQAIALDGGHADSYAGLAEALVYVGIFGFRPCAEALKESFVSARKALELDPSNAAAHNALGDVKKGLDWDLSGAEILYRRALELNPSRVLTRLWYAECLSRMQRWDDARAEGEKTIALDPLAAISYTSRSMLLWRSRHYEEAIASADKALDLNPSVVNALWWSGLACAGKRDFPQAIRRLEKAFSLNDSPMTRGYLAHVYGLAGDKARAIELVNGLAAMTGRYVCPADFATAYAGLGDADRTFEWLEKACQTRAGRVHELATPVYDKFREDPRYAELLKRVGLPTAQSG